MWFFFQYCGVIKIERAIKTIAVIFVTLEKEKVTHRKDKITNSNLRLAAGKHDPITKHPHSFNQSFYFANATIFD